MSSFEMTGTVLSATEKTSSKGNAYLAFQLQDNASQTFDMSLFGNTMNFAELVKQGKKVNIKGTLQSREYTDKNGVKRFNTSLQVAWVDAVGKKTEPKREYKHDSENADLDDLAF